MCYLISLWLLGLLITNADAVGILWWGEQVKNGKRFLTVSTKKSLAHQSADLDSRRLFLLLATAIASGFSKPFSLCYLDGRLSNKIHTLSIIFFSFVAFSLLGKVPIGLLSHRPY